MANESELVEEVAALLSKMPSTLRIAQAVLNVWPEHAKYLKKGLLARSPEQMQTTEFLASAALSIDGDRLGELAAHYRWTCDRLRDEELFFHREGRYRLASFEEADAEVYSNSDYMEKYVDGLLLSQVLWFNHVGSCDFYFRNAPQLISDQPRFLEIGPGHGLMTYLAVKNFAPSTAYAWDISPVSIEHTRKALARLDVTDVRCEVRDAMSLEPGDQKFDLIVLSEVLEHIEQPEVVVQGLRHILADDGLIFVNVPINSPSPDHIYLMETIEDARKLLTENGFAIEAEAQFATQGTKIDRALRNRISISVNMFARAI